MRAQIYCRARKGLTLTFDVLEDDADVGRDSQAPVSLPVDGVSRRHARITWDGKAHWVQDLKSTNGTFLNGEMVRRERLRHLDVITLGKAVNLIYVLRGEDYEPVQKQGIVAARLVPLSGEAVPYALPVGETTLGRSEACSVVTDVAAVSKIHARIERSTSRLALEDLGSSNGTLVNGERTRTAVLRHGDEVSLAGVETYRVEIEQGEISAPSGVDTGPPRPKPPQEDRPDFSAEWKTRIEWTSGEIEELERLRTMLPPGKTGSRRRRDAPEPSGGPEAAAAKTPAEPKASKAEPSRPEASRPAPSRPAPAKPETAKPETAKPETARPEPSKPQAPKPAPAPAGGEAASGPIVAVRLVAASFDLVARQPGEHRIGRSSEAALRVVHPTVSRKHACLFIGDDRRDAFVRHDGGANGTRLNGREIDRMEKLSDGDLIEVGDVKLRVAIDRS